MIVKERCEVVNIVPELGDGLFLLYKHPFLARLANLYAPCVRFLSCCCVDYRLHDTTFFWGMFPPPRGAACIWF